MASPLENPADATDPISFLKALSDCRLRRGIRQSRPWFATVRPCGGTIKQTASGAQRFIA